MNNNPDSPHERGRIIMTAEQLLIPRVQLTAQYPGSNLTVGDILYKHTFEETGNYCYVTNPEVLLLGSSKRKDEVEEHPHLFKPLQWYEFRKPEEMPEYVKRVKGLQSNIGDVRKVKEFLGFGKVVVFDEQTDGLTEFWEPATHQDYITFKESKK